jgi:hypothetical protein
LIIIIIITFLSYITYVCKRILQAAEKPPAKRFLNDREALIAEYEAEVSKEEIKDEPYGGRISLRNLHSISGKPLRILGTLEPVCSKEPLSPDSGVQASVNDSKDFFVLESS